MFVVIGNHNANAIALRNGFRPLVPVKLMDSGPRLTDAKRQYRAWPKRMPRPVRIIHRHAHRHKNMQGWRSRVLVNSIAIAHRTDILGAESEG